MLKLGVVRLVLRKRDWSRATRPNPWRLEGLSSMGSEYTLLSLFGLTPSMLAAPPVHHDVVHTGKSALLEERPLAWRQYTVHRTLAQVSTRPSVVKPYIKA